MTQPLAADMRLIEERRSDGAAIFRNSVELPERRPDILDRLCSWAASQPGHTLLTEPADGRRRSITYGAALEAANILCTSLRQERGLRRGSRIASLVPAGIDALVLKIACLIGGFVHASLPPFPFREGMPNRTGQRIVDIIRPDLVVAPAHHPAASHLGAVTIEVPMIGAAGSAGILEPQQGHGGDDWACIFFTSGSTGEPKGVPITRAMIASNQAAIAAMWPFMAERPVMIDWLPWHHVFGGLDNLFKIIWNGGTLHVDAPPGPATMDATIELMRSAPPTVHIAVPLGLKLLIERFEREPAAAEAFTRRLKAVFFAGAGIDGSLWQRLLDLQASSGNFVLLSGFGTTEAASTICLSHAPLERPGELGIPLPGHSIALAEVDGRTEMRVKGPNVAPCYLTAEGTVPLPADEFGYYRTGDAAILRERHDGLRTLGFDGRLAEDFKLSSGVKVRTGPLRAALMAHCAPLLDDIVVAGENRDRLVALVFPSAAGRRQASLTDKIARRLHEWNLRNAGSSTRIARFDIATQPPDRANGEISDKGQIVQSRFLTNHAPLFETLHAGAGHAPAAEASTFRPAP